MNLKILSPRKATVADTRTPRLYQAKVSLGEDKVRVGKKTFDRGDCRIVVKEGSTDTEGRIYLDVGSEHSFEISWR